MKIVARYEIDAESRNQKKLLRRVLNPKKGGTTYCSVHDDVCSRTGCRNAWWAGRCENVMESKTSRAFCQSVNFPKIGELEPLGKPIIPMRNVEKEMRDDLKKQNKVRSIKMAIDDKASKLLSNATDAKSVLKIVKTLKGLPSDKVKSLEEQVKSGSGYGRIKMTALNIIRGAIARGEFGKDLPVKVKKEKKSAVAMKSVKNSKSEPKETAEVKEESGRVSRR